MKCLAGAFGVCAVLVTSSLSSIVAAEEAAPATRKSSFVFTGRALYLEGGGGVIADIHEPTLNTRLLLTLPVARWAMFEGLGFATYFAAESHHDIREESVGLGIGLGMRFAPPPDRPLRPHVALRAVHVHMTPDLWGTHPPDDPEQDSSHHESMHRWGAALATGVEAPLLATTTRWRVGVEGEGLLLSGPGANVFGQVVATVGCAL